MKTLILKCLLLSTLAFLGGCSSTPKKSLARPLAPKEAFGSFDKVYIPNEAPLIAHMISVVQPELEINLRNKVANDIYHAINIYKIEPQIIVALIDTESNFKYSKVSTTGDLSLGQVNVEVWNKEFTRMKLPLIEKKKLVTADQSYAMEVMAQILSILKKRHAKSDRRWYARYHSNTSKYKLDYLKKIEIRMKLLSGSRLIMEQTSLAFLNQKSQTIQNKKLKTNDFRRNLL